MIVETAPAFCFVGLLIRKRGRPCGGTHFIGLRSREVIAGKKIPSGREAGREVRSGEKFTKISGPLTWGVGGIARI